MYSSTSLKRSSPISQAFPRRASGLVNLGSFSKVLIGRICPLPLKALVVSHPQKHMQCKECCAILRCVGFSYLCHIDQFSVFPRTCVKKVQSILQAYQYEGRSKITCNFPNILQWFRWVYQKFGLVVQWIKRDKFWKFYWFSSNE